MTFLDKEEHNPKVRHPAQRLYILTLGLLGLMVLFGFIAVFVPWVMKDIGIGQRAWAYPFKTCIEDTFSITNAEACQDNDFIEPTGVPLTGGNPTCKAFILATIAFVFISVIGGVITLLLLLLVLDLLMKRPVCLAMTAQACLIVVCITAILSWIMFLCYAEKTCAEGSIFPVHGYSYGFILYIFASTFALASVVTGFLALRKLRAFSLEDSVEDRALVVAEEEYHADVGMAYPQPTPNPHTFSEPAEQPAVLHSVVSDRRGDDFPDNGKPTPTVVY